MGYTQATAANILGLSLSAYARSEYRCQDRPGTPTSATLAKLASLLEWQWRQRAIDLARVKP